jgi:hypothetical protein
VGVGVQRSRWETGVANGTNLPRILDDPLVYVSSSGWQQQPGFRMSLREAARRPTDARAIYSRVVAKAIPHRLRLVDWLAKVSGRDMRAAANHNTWLPSFHHRLQFKIQSMPLPGAAAAASLRPEAAS